MPDRLPTRIAFVASRTPTARRARAALVRRYGDAAVEDAEVVVALGGDGVMLQTLHQLLGTGRPIYGLNRGSVGFLMNEWRENDLPRRLAEARRTVIHPLRMRVRCAEGEETDTFAINEVSLLRAGAQSAKLRVSVDGRVRLDQLMCDGLIVATPAGSTAYNLSANGPILPLAAPLLAVTPISAFRPRRWRGAIVPDRASIGIEILEPAKRPVNAVGDNREVRDTVEVRVEMDHAVDLVMLHDPGHSLEERILREQFDV